MKKNTIGIFNNREDAEQCINHIHSKLNVSKDEISYLYKNDMGETKEVDVSDISDDTPMEGAKKGAKTGAAIGALGGIVAVAGMIPVIGPLFAAGPLLSAIGITGAVGTTAAGAITGAAVGGVVGALINMGVGEDEAKNYEDQVTAGNVLVAVHTDKADEIEESMLDHGATDVGVYAVRV